MERESRQEESSLTYEEARRFVLETEPHGTLRLFAVIVPQLRALGITLLAHRSIRVCAPWYEHVQEIQLQAHQHPVRYVPRVIRPIVHFKDGLPCDISINGFDEKGNYAVFPYYGKI